MVELLFMMLVLKLPAVYLGLVCWWAIRAEPRPAEPALLPAVLPEEPGPAHWQPRRSPRRRGPHGSPVRGYARTQRAAAALP